MGHTSAGEGAQGVGHFLWTAGLGPSCSPELESPAGAGWVHEITRTGLDWSRRYRRTIEALQSLKVKSAYIDGELYALNAEGMPAQGRVRDDPRGWTQALGI